MFKKLLSFTRLPVREKIWFILFYPLSGIIRAMILTIPYRYLSKFFGEYRRNDQLSVLANETEKMTAWRIGRIAELCSAYTPWESKCLVQATMVRILLGYYGIPYIMHLGATLTKDLKEPMKAHAWVKVGPWVVSGRDGHKAFGITATYTSRSIG